MKIAIFGATGRTGRYLVKQGLEKGHQVVAFARTVSKLDLQDEHLTVLRGDVQEPDQVAGAVKGADAVVSVLGPTSNTPDYEISQGMDNILAAMRKYNVRRLVVSVGAGVRDPGDKPGLVDKVIGWIVRTFSRYVYEDMKRVYEKVRASDRDWVIVRVPRLTNDPEKGEVRAGYVGKGVGARLSRADMAEFMLAQVEKDDYLHQAPAISN